MLMTAIKTSMREMSTMTKSRMLNYSERYFLKPSAMILMRHSATKMVVKNVLAYPRMSSSVKPGPG